MQQSRAVTDTTVDNNLFGRNITAARAFAGMSQRQLADAIGVPRPVISSWENGRHEPRRETRDRLAAVLGKPVWWFYRDHTANDGEAA